MYAMDRGLWNAFRGSILYDSMKDSFLFLEAVYTGMGRQEIYNQFIPEGSQDQINISHALVLKLTNAAFADPFVQADWDAALVEARNEIEDMLDSQDQLRTFWESDNFWNYHLASGGTDDDIRNQTELDDFVSSFEQHGWNKISLGKANELLAVEGKTWTPKELQQRLVAQGLIREKNIYNPDAAAKHFNSTNVLPLQEFMQKYAYKNWKLAEILADATRCMAAAGINGSPEEFIDELLNEGFMQPKEPTDNLTIDDFLLRLPQGADAHIDAVLDQIADSIATGDDGLARELATMLAEEMIEQADLSDGATIISALLSEYLHHIGSNRARANGPGGGARQNGAAGRQSTFRDTDSHLSLEMDEWLSLDGGDSSDGNDGQEETEDDDGRSEGGRLTLDDFVLRLPNHVDGLIEARMGDIAWAMTQNDDPLADTNIDALVRSLVEASAPADAALAPLQELRDYIQQIARNRARQAARTAPGNGPGPDDDDDDDSRRSSFDSSYFSDPLASFRDVRSHRSDGGDDRSSFDSSDYSDPLDSFRDAGSTVSSDDEVDDDSRQSRSPSEELDDFLADSVDAPDSEDGNRREATNAGGHQGEGQPGNGGSGNAKPSGVQQSELLTLIKNARHIAGSSEIDRLMQQVRNALVAGNIPHAQQFARTLASLLLGGPRKEPHLQTWFAEEVRKVTITILAEISRALKERKGKAGNGAGGNPGDGPRDRGPGPGPDGGSAGANGNTRGNGNANGGGATTAPQADDVYNRDTMDRMERERNASAPKGDLAALVATDIRAITKMLAEKKIEEAKQRAVALSKQLVGNGGVVPEMPAETILKLAHGKVAALRASNPEVTPAPTSTPTNGAMPTAGGADDGDDDEPVITLDPEIAERLVPVTDWKVFCGVYQIEVSEIKAIKALALKAVWEPKDAHAGCKLLISRREDKGKSKGKSQVKIKNEKYLAQALVHAVKMKAVKKTLKKPMKATGAADL
ncbi:hypothetical protein [Rhizobium sp. GN54]|uniref:hypothetical protein n=1 Tax=Rhizobium sp. GN54 TaxID=2898150 RepID=UPI001E357D93|nr:hypothetical protein [Rhizobium sp. GN54]MCD2184620.1 hypothetical protein [Rhizobium sp. GN54]